MSHFSALAFTASITMLVIATFTEHHLIVIGVLFMLSVIFLPQGLIGYLRPHIERLIERRTRKS